MARASRHRSIRRELAEHQGHKSTRSKSGALGAAAGHRAALTSTCGNHSGNPGAATRHHRTAMDGIAPAPEQPHWSWAGLAEEFRSDS
jgi:hypothetical protein